TSNIHLSKIVWHSHRHRLSRFDRGAKHLPQIAPFTPLTHVSEDSDGRRTRLRTTATIIKPQTTTTFSFQQLNKKEGSACQRRVHCEHEAIRRHETSTRTSADASRNGSPSATTSWRRTAVLKQHYY
ncbi:unnamed protein product, partial [Ectocarpus sp. 4 AP-2014]